MTAEPDALSRGVRQKIRAQSPALLLHNAEGLPLCTLGLLLVGRRIDPDPAQLS